MVRPGWNIHTKWDLLRNKHVFLILFHLPKPLGLVNTKEFPNISLLFSSVFPHWKIMKCEKEHISTGFSVLHFLTDSQNGTRKLGRMEGNLLSSTPDFNFLICSVANPLGLHSVTKLKLSVLYMDLSNPFSLKYFYLTW